MDSGERKNGVATSCSERSSSPESETEGCNGVEGEWVIDEQWPNKALASLNSLRKSRQHYDVLVRAGAAEIPAHRALLAALCPRLLVLPVADELRLDEHCDAAALAQVVEYAYTGKLSVPDVDQGIRLYHAALAIGAEVVRVAVGGSLVRRAGGRVLAVRRLPELGEARVAALDAHIAAHWAELAASGALAQVPSLRVELIRESSAVAGTEPPHTIADAALIWVREQLANAHSDKDVEKLCARTHLLYVNSSGALRDCGELPDGVEDTEELREYRRERGSRSGNRGNKEGPPGSVLGASKAGHGGTTALLSVGPHIVAAHFTWRGGVGPGLEKGAPLPPAATAETARATLAEPRCAHGTLGVNNKLLVCGGYDRTRALRSAEWYDPETNMWNSAPLLRGPRARLAAAKLGNSIYAIGGSDGHNELDTVEVLDLEKNAWVASAKLPAARSHLAVAVDEKNGRLFAVGGWAGGRSLKRVHMFDVESKTWSDTWSLRVGRSQCGAAIWRGGLWAIGGCDEWHSLASVELLNLSFVNESVSSETRWVNGPNLSAGRRGGGAAVWRGRVVLVGGADAGVSLNRTDYLTLASDDLSKDLAEVSVDSPTASANPSEAYKWIQGPNLRTGRSGVGVATVGTALYAAGGFSGQNFLSSLECLYEPNGEWTNIRCNGKPETPIGIKTLSLESPIKEKVVVKEATTNGNGEKHANHE